MKKQDPAAPLVLTLDDIVLDRLVTTRGFSAVVTLLENHGVPATYDQVRAAWFERTVRREAMIARSVRCTLEELGILPLPGSVPCSPQTPDAGPESLLPHLLHKAGNGFAAILRRHPAHPAPPHADHPEHPSRCDQGEASQSTPVPFVPDVGAAATVHPPVYSNPSPDSTTRA